jgi:ABC-2 type transport system ATP-binding protein/lipopolysaccharide transport system ATP-binding protein
MNAIELKRVSLRYRLRGVKVPRGKQRVQQGGGGGELRVVGKEMVVDALNNVSLCIRPGERVGLVGHTGAGKSTLLRVMAGVFRPQKGEVTVNGEVTCLFDRMLGMDRTLNAYQNVLVKGTVMGYSRREIEARMADILAVADLGDFADIEVRHYAAGMAARLGFVIATAFPCDIVLIDEWAGVGDRRFRKTARERLAQLARDSGTVVMASHNLALLRENCERVIQLEHGHVVYDGPVPDRLASLDGGDDGDEEDDE